MAQVECPACKGRGKEVVFHNATPEQRNGFSLEICTICKGSGKTTEEIADKITRRQKTWDKILNG